jgi:hypothetical protein
MEPLRSSDQPGPPIVPCNTPIGASSMVMVPRPNSSALKSVERLGSFRKLRYVHLPARPPILDVWVKAGTNFSCATGLTACPPFAHGRTKAARYVGPRLGEPVCKHGRESVSFVTLRGSHYIRGTSGLEQISIAFLILGLLLGLHLLQHNQFIRQLGHLDPDLHWHTWCN